MAEKTLYISGDNYQLRNAIFSATPKAIEQTRSIARQFKGDSELATASNIFNFLKNNITYIADGVHQKIKLPSALMRERSGDCKSYSLFTMGILSNLGIPAQYVLTSYNQDPTPTHIYVKTKSGIIIDAVWGRFNSEKKYNHVYTKSINGINDMKISYISGVRGVPQSVRTKIAGCGCGCKGTGKCGIGETKAERLLREAKEKLQSTGTKIALSLPRQVALGVFSLNFDGISSTMNNTSRMSKYVEIWKKIGGDEASLRAAIRDGASRPVKKFGFMKKIEDLIRSRVKSKLGISGIGAVSLQQNQQIKDLLMDDGATSIAYRSTIISTMGGIGASLGAAVGSAFAGIGAAPGGAAGVTAGGYIGELLYQATPTLVDKIFPVATSSSNPLELGGGNNPSGLPDGDDSGSRAGKLVLPLVIGAGLLFFVMNKK